MVSGDGQGRKVHDCEVAAFCIDVLLKVVSIAGEDKDGQTSSHVQPKRLPNMIEMLASLSHLPCSPFPKRFALPGYHGIRNSFLERTNSAKANADMRSRHMLNQLRRSNDPADSPTGQEEGFAG